MLAYNFTTDCLTYNPNFDIEIHNYSIKSCVYSELTMY